VEKNNVMLKSLSFLCCEYCVDLFTIRICC